MIREALGLIYTGEQDSSLKDLTLSRSVAAMPMWGRYRAIDFLLSNLVNSGVGNVAVITQRRYHSLMDHLGSGRDWDLNRKREGLFILPPFMTKDDSGIYRGSVDALRSAKGFLKHARQQYVILSGSHVLFKTTYNEALEHHMKTGADITVFYNHVNPDEMRQLGERTHFQMDRTGQIYEIECNPAHPKSDQVSMGVYIVDKALLEYLVEECASRDEFRFTEGILIPKLKNLKIMGYEYPGYVARLESVYSYFHHNLMALNDKVRQELFYESGPVFTKVKDEVPALYGDEGEADNCMVADGCIVEGHVENSILFRGVKVGKGAVIRNSVVMQASEIQDGALLENVILDKQAIVRHARKLVGQPGFPIVVGKQTVI
ncbi:glucose-1-phosphate adenylyltransferase subunit GlgD [Gehongia tenuis]|uniref:Glucose-1-phosphate adenylyltransferase subunit GlgD n=1 Tax=Gehongia tenuis TaxID=2763655 RepID=A0A926D0Z3_9FIRM|nr:glucose-1-phosphate adenylyltransferase subunit GlgD [Gehongia tenuis]MBC8530365.1 glucose-1-phosphate adenylyltransferase subunit GlgD [Gehongia tenuis]